MPKATAEKPAILDRFRQLFSLPRDEAAAVIGEHGVNYFKEYFDGRVSPEAYIEKARLMVRLTNAAGAELLDVGCGHGFMVCLAEACGAAKAEGIEIHGGKITEARQLAAWLGCTNCSFTTYDGTHLPYPEQSFDVVMITAALSHVRDVDQTLSDMRRVLRDGGRFYTFEDNNAFHYKYAERIHPVWEYGETGKGIPGHSTKSDQWVPYVDRRAKMIREWFPDLTDERVSELAKDTKGLVLEEIQQAVSEHLRTGEPVHVDKPFRYYAPDTGEALEYPFTPPMLKRMVSEHFGRVRVHSAITPPYIGSKGVLKRLAKWAGAVLPPVMWKTQATFIVTGVRERDEDL